jgi:hypothetical protein
MTHQPDLFVPPAAEGLPPGALDSAAEGADRLDAVALTPNGRNLLAHALVQLARDGWLRTEPGEGFEPERAERETPEPMPASSAGAAPATDRAAELDRLRTENERMRHELEVMYGGAFDTPKAATDQTALRNRIAAALLARIKQATVSKARPADALTSLFAANEFDLADAVLPVLRGLTLREVEQLYRPNTPPSRPEPRRMAVEAQQPEAEPPVAYSGKGRAFCLTCPRPDGEDVPLTVDDIQPYECCAACGRDLVDVAAAQQPKEA